MDGNVIVLPGKPGYRGIQKKKYVVEKTVISKERHCREMFPVVPSLKITGEM